MGDINYKTVVVKCPNTSCKTNIQLSIGKSTTGFNDSGGWILECEKCKTKFPYKVKNPDDYSSVEGGAIILDSWDNDMIELKADILIKHNLESFPDDFHFDNLLLVETGEYEKVQFSDIDENIFFCPKCKSYLEPLVYHEISKKKIQINQSIGAYMNYYLKGRAGNPDYIIVIADYKCSCGFETKIVLSKKFIERELPIEDKHELILIDVVGANLEFTIDGIYNRNSCLEILQKLLNRWQVYYNHVLLAVPFIIVLPIL